MVSNNNYINLFNYNLNPTKPNNHNDFRKEFC